METTDVWRINYTLDKKNYNMNYITSILMLVISYSLNFRIYIQKNKRKTYAKHADILWSLIGGGGGGRIVRKMILEKSKKKFKTDQQFYSKLDAYE